MRLLAIVKKELKHYFYSPMAYVVVCIFLVIAGWFFSNELFLVGEAELRGMMRIMPLILMFVIPAVTMRSIAEEKKVDTIQLILTMPVKEWEIVMGKYIATILLYLTILVFTLIYPLVLYLIGRPDTGVLIGEYTALLLLGMSYISIGIFASSLTSNQVIAFIIAFAILFLFFVLGRLVAFFPPYLQEAVERVSAVTHFENMLRGVITSSDIVYFLSLNFLFLFLTTYVLEGRR